VSHNFRLKVFHLDARTRETETNGRSTELLDAGTAAGSIICTHLLAEGPCEIADYGLRTAASAGMPRTVLERAVLLKQKFNGTYSDSVRVQVSPEDSRFRRDLAMTQQIRLLKGARLSQARLRERLRVLKNDYSHGSK